MINIFILCTKVVIENMFGCWLYSQHCCIYQKIKSNLIFPIMHYFNIAPCAERTCPHDIKASTVMSYPLETPVYDVTILALLSHRHFRHMT